MTAATNPIGLTRAYARASHTSSLWQLCNTLLLYAAVIALMFASLEVHYAITLLLSLVASVAYLRLFMIGHDCSHGSFMPRAWQNGLIGNLMGVLTNTPFRYWARQHALHHRGNGNLDRRGDGDVWLMTVVEYEAAPRLVRVGYRIFRNPAFLFGIAAPLHFVLLQRVPLGHGAKTVAGWVSTLGTNLGIALYYGALIAAFGWKAFLLVYIPVVYLSSMFSVWLFYVQHQFPGAYFRRNDEWKYQEAAVEGSSFYDLPRLLHWASANIGFHHIHHLNPNVPNYRLPEIHAAHPEFERANRLGLAASLGTARLALWSEEERQLVSFASARRRGRAGPRAQARA
jgi:omega-6 fatty acid desaturase (delta-12 desaturase)